MLIVVLFISTVAAVQAFDIEIIADVGDDLLATRNRALDLRIPARRQQQLVARLHFGVGMGQLVTVGLPPVGGGTEAQSKAVFGAQREADADAAAFQQRVIVLPDLALKI
ncbi:hypothetical protein [Pseudomonas syringae]|uniref:hypothetical protein n=1 Tax=Pseudomonas syringae TaxID=317 RepID=UPI0023F6233C|nr:hypothetical protein [Pseudomonas syringae]MDF7797726.1 hypothetical protein [Pseudomonas syringae]